jgi:putative transposase
MLWGLTRFHHSGQSHFVTLCCYHRRRLFTTDASRRIFESALERVRRSFRLQVYGYVVMPSMFTFCSANHNRELPHSSQNRA